MANQDLVFNILARDRNAKKTFKDIGDAADQAARKISKLDGAGAGASLADSLIGGFQSALKVGTSGPAVAGALLGAVAVAAQPISALLSSAVLAGVGGGVIAGGIALAARDPQVKKAAGDLRQQISEGLTDAAGPFTGPVLRGIELLSATAKDVMPEVRAAFELLAPTVDKLFAGFDGFIRRALPGFMAGLEGARPILDAIAAGLPELGDAIGDAFSVLSSDSGRLTKDIVILMSAAAEAIRLTAAAVSLLGNEFNNSLERGLQLAKFLADVGEVVFAWVPGGSAAMKGFGQAAQDALSRYRSGADAASTSTAETTRRVEDLNAEIRSLEGKQVEVQESGAANSQQRVAELQRQIDSLRGKVVDITYRQTTWGSAPAVQSGYGKVISGYRRGGITPVHARDGLLSQGNVFNGGSPLYAFAEPETGQEAFIPRNGNMDRSRGIARTVVDKWLGGPEKLWGGRGGGSVYNITVPVTVAPGASATQMGAEAGAAVIQVIKQYERNNGTSWRS